MIIKIARPNPVPVLEEGPVKETVMVNEITKPKFRPEVSFLTIECTRFKHHMIPRDQYSEEGALPGSMLIPDEVILTVGTIRSVDGEPDEPIYDELCVLEVEAPEHRVVVFDTVAYVCNDAGQTQERIQPQKKFIGRPVDKGFGHLKRRSQTFKELLCTSRSPEACIRCDRNCSDRISELQPHKFEGDDDFKPCTKCKLPFGNGIHTDERWPRTGNRDPNLVDPHDPKGPRFNNHKFDEARDGKCYRCGLSVGDPVHRVKKHRGPVGELGFVEANGEGD
jgi:hypothetical protein